MSVLQIISGILLIITSILIIALVLMQTSKGNGLSGAIGGGEMMNNEGRSRSVDAILAKNTKIAAIVFIIVTIAVSVISAITGK